MPTRVAVTSTVVPGLKAMYTDALPDEIKVGDSKAPTGAVPDDPETMTDGYVILYAIDGGTITGDLEAPEADADAVVQVAAVGRSRAQAGIIADHCRYLLLSHEDDSSWTNELSVETPKFLTDDGFEVVVTGRAAAGPPSRPEQQGTLWRQDDRYVISVSTVRTAP